jgi:hypothetical protein
MKKIFHRLLPVVSLLCLPLLGGYTPVITRESLHLDGAQLEAITGKMAAQGGTVTREYLFTIIATAPPGGGIEGALRDFGPLADYRFFSMLTNFRNVQIQAAMVARTPLGQQIITAEANAGRFLNPAYVESWTYPRYGRFMFNWGMMRVHDAYGRNGLFPWDNNQYLQWVQRDMLVRATGTPTPGLEADPAGW